LSTRLVRNYNLQARAKAAQEAKDHPPTKTSEEETGKEDVEKAD
jgi:hypothetical protein